jgi:beta-lactamase regulating signal transducer with metallopeptidase domain
MQSFLLMNSFFHAASLAAASAVGGLLSAAWEGAVLAVCVLLCLRLFPGLSAAARSVIWMIVFAAVVLLHGLPVLATHGAVYGVARPARFQLGIAWCIGIAAVWLALSLLRAGQLAASALRLRGLARRATPVARVNAAIEACLEVKIIGRFARRAILCTSTEVERPSVFGFFHPRILLPPALMDRLSATELQQVVLHEMEHLRRADDWTNLLQKMALVVFPLNPALLWVEHRLCAERELACDDSVLKSSCGRKAYAICLTRLAEYTMLRRSLSLALGAWERQSELVRRVHRILRRPVQQMSARQTMALTGGLMAAVLLSAAGLARSPQLVGFSAPVASQGVQPEFAQARMQSVSTAAFHPGAIDAQGEFGHAHMVNAVMRERTAPAAAKPRLQHRKVAMAATMSASRQTAPAMQQTLIVMTAWSGDSMAPQVVFTVARTTHYQAFASEGDARPQLGSASQRQIRPQETQAQQETSGRATYAAVPFANGWLFVRI